MKLLLSTAVHSKLFALLRGIIAFSVVTSLWLLSGTAQARDNIHWSIGVHSPGLNVGAFNTPFSYPSYDYPVYEPRPVVVYPRPIVVRPRPVVIYEHHPGDHRHWKERGYAKYEHKDRYKKYRSYRDRDHDDDDDD